MEAPRGVTGRPEVLQEIELEVLQGPLRCYNNCDDEDSDDRGVV